MTINNELITIFIEKLRIFDLPKEEQEEFLKSIVKYLKHNGNSEMKGRTKEYLTKKLDTFIEIGTAIGLTYEQLAHIITSSPSLLNTIDSFYEKYLLLGVVENEENTVRRDKLLSKPKDFIVGIPQIYARYKLICESGYNKFTWNALVHATKSEFASIFVENAYSKPYQLFSDEIAVNNWLAQVDPSEIDFASLKEMEVNKELVAKYERKEKGLN